MTISGTQLDPLAVLAAPPPRYTPADVRQFVRRHYGLDGVLEPLLSERDQNFRLQLGTGERFVVKIANPAEPAIATDLQLQALLHLEQTGCAVAVPRVIRTRSGAVTAIIAADDAADGRDCVARVVTYLPGTPAALLAQGPPLAQALGAALACVDAALSAFTHPGDRHALLWDLQHAPKLADLIHHIAEKPLRARVAACLCDYEQRVSAALPALRYQVIHGDLNASNVLVATDGCAVAGIIDFGDMVRAPLINDVAIGASYLRVTAGDPLALVGPFVAGFSGTTELADAEIDLLYDLMRTRLAATITILRWRLAERGPEDAYARASIDSERSAEQFLEALDGLSRSEFTAGLLAACGR